MKYRLTVVAIVIGVLGLVSAFAYAQGTPVPTETPATSSVIQQDIFVRGGPGRDYLPVGKLLVGDHVRPLSRNVQGDWVLIVYGKGYGWIRRDLAFWVENIDALSIIDVVNLTPSLVIPTTPSATPVLLPSFTPVGNWVQLGNDAQSGFVRAGPGRTYLRLGQLFTGDAVEPVSQNADGLWIMIRFGDGFGWVARNLVLWVDNIDSLPIVSVDNLTPSATFTATNTSTATATATSTLISTNTPTVTPTFTASFTVTATSSATLTETPVPTLTATLTPTNTATVIPTETLIPTLEPSLTSTPSATVTQTATLIPTVTLTFTATPTETLIPTLEPSLTSTPSATVTHAATLVPTVEPTSTFTATSVPSEMPTIVEAAIVPSATVVIQPTQTATFTATSSPIPPTDTEQPSPTYTATATLTATSNLTLVPPTQTSIPSATFTATLLPTTLLPITSTQITNQLPTARSALATETVSIPTQIASPTSTTTPEQTRVAGALSAPTSTPNLGGGNTPSGGLSPEVLIAGIVLLAILVYAFLYWRGTSSSERYTSGFVIETCPVCQRGHLIVESRQERVFGIPRARHSVRCSECRSVLREVSDHQWRYAVDPIANPDLYQRLNGKIIDEQTLIDLSREQTGSSGQRSTSVSSNPPDFVDDDT